MQNQQYVTITHYKEREFYFLNYAIQTSDGFITKDIEQFHESEKDAFIERIRELQAIYPKNQTISLSLTANQVVKDAEDPHKASAKIFKENYVVQEKMDIGNLPVTLYFSPFAVLYEEYKEKLGDKLTLLIGYFDRKLFIMFATADKIDQSWILGTRGLSEKQIADRVYKSMKAYYKISYKFADQVEMLVSDDSPKLLKVLREELSMNILPTQKTIHALLHHMGAEQSRFGSSYIKSFLSSTQQTERASTNYTKTESLDTSVVMGREAVAEDSLNDIRLNHQPENLEEVDSSPSFFDKLTGKKKKAIDKQKATGLFAFLPLVVVLATGGYFTVEKSVIQDKMNLIESQSLAQSSNEFLTMTSKDIFSSMGKSAELNKALISNENIELKGVVWGIEPLRNSLNNLYSDGEFIIKPLENFMTEFSFKAKV